MCSWFHGSALSTVLGPRSTIKWMPGTAHCSDLTKIFGGWRKSLFKPVALNHRSTYTGQSKFHKNTHFLYFLQ